MGIFFYLVSFWYKRFGQNKWEINIVGILLMGALWSSLEYIRSFMFSGFAWNFLGISQYQNTGLIQIAEYGGVYIVSAVIVVVNASLSMLILRRLYHIKHGGRTMFHPELTVALLILGFSLVNGNRTMTHLNKKVEYEALFVGIVQPAIVQDQKWLEENSLAIFDEVLLQTRQLQEWQADLIIWPETVLPVTINSYDGESFMHEVFRASNTPPVLVGAIDMQAVDSNAVYRNASILFEKYDQREQVYYKRHLVPFGEYLPLPGLMSLLGVDKSLGFVSCVPGNTSTVFRLSKPSAAFSSLLCFEDTLPALARESVKNGARFLVVQTNDAWFDHTAALRQHMAHSVFRAIENRVAVIRVGNTGLSCWIRPSGKIQLECPPYKPLNDPVVSAVVPMVQGDHALSMYAKIGDRVYAFFAVLAVVGFVLALRMERQENTAIGSSDNQEPEISKELTSND
jgi:apolipoprotein N-acyltransferase